jgi:Uma2 family endonuclease
MVEMGLLDPDERIELIHGEIIDMGREGAAHWHARQKLISWLLRRLPVDIELAPDGPLRLADDEEPEPDFYLFPASMNVNDVRGGDVILAVEIADSSLNKDRDIKAPLYAAHGVREYWIIDLENRVTLKHKLAQGAYSAPEPVAFDASHDLPGVSAQLVLADVLK